MDKSSIKNEDDFWEWHMNPYPMQKFRFNDDFTVDVVFCSGEARRYDMRPYIQKLPMISYILKDIELFKHPRSTSQSTIVWDDNADITADWIYEDGIPIEVF